MRVCPSCGRENAEDARFCSGCATPLGEAAPGREERKVVTVLFCDLVGATARAEKLDPEDVRALLSRYHDRVRAELERYGGTVEKFIGDAVMALFGAPVAHEDDPERAVRAALAIREWAEDEDELQVRIGITTGEALVSLGARLDRGEGMAAGDVVNTAARLQSAAAANGIVVDDTTYRATERVIDYRARGPVDAKGKAEPVSVWEAVQARARFGVDVRQHGPALVGRERELDVLVGALERTKQEQTPQLVTLVGVPGVGKSRLVWELFRQLRGPDLVYWRQGRSLPYGEGVSFWALGEMVKAHAGILESDPPAAVEQKLARALAEAVADTAERGWIATHLRPLVGAFDEEGAQFRGGEEAFAAWRRFFESLAERRPLVLVFEDLHWADEGVLDFVDHLVDWAGGVPILVVCTARPELLERRPGWGGGKRNAATIALASLSDADTARLISALLDRSVLPAETQAELLERAGGNPLYAEQFTRLLRERGSLAEEAVPENVQAIIAARLDGLTPVEKRLVQDAAVIGKVFWPGALAAIGSQERDALVRALHVLERQEFVRRDRRSSIAGEDEFAFRHALVRDVAYAQIPRAARAEKHRVAAEWIEALGRPDDHADMLAHHYSAALEFARAAGGETAALEQRARHALRAAGERAAALNAFAAAARFFEEALALWPRDDEDRSVLLFDHGRARYYAEQSGDAELGDAAEALLAAGRTELAAEAEVMRADLQWHRGSHEGMQAHLERALQLSHDAPASPSKAFVLSQASRFAMLADRNDEAVRLGREALAIAEARGLDTVRAHALNNIGTARANSGDYEGIEDLEESLALALAINSPEAARAYINLSVVLAMSGDARRAREVAREGLRLAERFGIPANVRWLRAFRASWAYAEGDWEAAGDYIAEFLDELAAGEPHYLEGMARVFRALIALARDDVELALADTARALELARAINDPQAIIPSLAARANILAATGDAEGANSIVSELLERQAPGDSSGPLRAELVDTFLQLGRGDELLAALRGRPSTKWVAAATALLEGDPVRAADLYDEIGVVPGAAYTRLRAAASLVEAGRRAEADEQLQRALAFFRSVRATRYIREGEALLAASA